jgi:23S rRNA (uracil1939-C5)-methyltransferase
MTLPATHTLLIDHLGQRGDGVAAGPVYVPYALPGETIEAGISGERGRLRAVMEASPFRIAPFCQYFGHCGGCAIQHLAEPQYRSWKRGLVVTALAHAGVEAEVGDLVEAHGAGRRRATFHARHGRLGFAEARSHQVVDIEHCPILLPALNRAIPACREIARALGVAGKPLDLLVTATRTGIDLDIRGAGKIAQAVRLRLAELATEHDLARLSLHGDVVIARRVPLIRFGAIDVAPPPGAFLQATEAADTLLAGLVQAGVGGSRKAADLFAGCGTLSFILAATAAVTAVDADGAATAALDRAARHAQGLKPIAVERRDLFRRPLLPADLARFDAVVFDPPRAGAAAQCAALAASRVRRIVAVSCNPATFARDAATLIAGGYRLRSVIPIDQFRHTPHVELVGAFER